MTFYTFWCNKKSKSTTFSYYEICFVAIYALFVWRKIVAKNVPCGEKMTNMMYGLVNLSFVIFAVISSKWLHCILGRNTCAQFRITNVILMIVFAEAILSSLEPDHQRDLVHVQFLQICEPQCRCIFIVVSVYFRGTANPFSKCGGNKNVAAQQ